MEFIDLLISSTQTLQEESKVTDNQGSLKETEASTKENFKQFIGRTYGDI